MDAGNPLDAKDFEKRCYEESKKFLLESMRTGTRRVSEAAATLLTYDMDKATASELLNQLETLPEEPQRILFRKAAQLLDKNEIAEFCRKLLSQEEPPPFISEAIVIIHHTDAALAEKTLINLLSSSEESYVCCALIALRNLRLPRCKQALISLAASGYVRIRRLVWEIIGAYPLSGDERSRLLSKGLADFDPFVRSSAVSLMPGTAPDRIAAYINDPQPSVRMKAALRLVAAGVGADKFLEYTDYAHTYAEEAARSYGGIIDAEPALFAKQVIDFCVGRTGALMKVMPLVDTATVYGIAIQRVLYDEFSGWRKVLLLNWAFLNRAQELMKLLPLLVDPDQDIRRRAVEVFLNNLPAAYHGAVTDTPRPADPARAEETLLEVFCTLPAAVKAMIAAAARNSWLKLSHEARRALTDSARQDANKWVAAEAAAQ